MPAVTKQRYAEQIQIVATNIAMAVDRAADLTSIYFDRGYNGGGADPIVDGDVSEFGYTAADIAAFITLSQQLQNFVDHVAVASGDYDATLNRLRTDA